MTKKNIHTNEPAGQLAWKGVEGHNSKNRNCAQAIDVATIFRMGQMRAVRAKFSALAGMVAIDLRPPDLEWAHCYILDEFT